MTHKEAVLISAYTGYLLAPSFADVHEFCEELLGRPIMTHQFGFKEMQEEIREKGGRINEKVKTRYNRLQILHGVG